jgi:hypothetical protein
MNDIHFNIKTKDIVLDSNNEFEFTANPSIQNGGIIQFSRCSFISNPMLGIGMTDLINAATSKTAYEMNRWQQQCVNDQASFAKWTSKNLAGNTIEIDTEISYL